MPMLCSVATLDKSAKKSSPSVDLRTSAGPASGFLAGSTAFAGEARQSSPRGRDARPPIGGAAVWPVQRQAREAEAPGAFDPARKFTAFGAGDNLAERGFWARKAEPDPLASSDHHRFPERSLAFSVGRGLARRQDSGRDAGNDVQGAPMQRISAAESFPGRQTACHYTGRSLRQRATGVGRSMAHTLLLGTSLQTGGGAPETGGAGIACAERAAECRRRARRVRGHRLWCQYRNDRPNPPACRVQLAELRCRQPADRRFPVAPARADGAEPWPTFVASRSSSATARDTDLFRVGHPDFNTRWLASVPAGHAAPADRSAGPGTAALAIIARSPPRLIAKAGTTPNITDRD